MKYKIRNKRPQASERPVMPWYRPLDRLLGAPMRIHRYRNLHAQVVEKLLRNDECGDRP